MPAIAGAGSKANASKVQNNLNFDDLIMVVSLNVDFYRRSVKIFEDSETFNLFMQTRPARCGLGQISFDAVRYRTVRLLMQEALAKKTGMDTRSQQMAKPLSMAIAHKGGTPALSEFTPRQREVLGVVLDLMVEAGDDFSLAKVCKRASCSKQTLYSWFGDRDGLLTATVRWQASKVNMPQLAKGDPGAEAFRRSLIIFATSWLEVITSDVSAALNRLAITHAGTSKSRQESRLGNIVLNNGPLAMIERVKVILLRGQELGHIKLGPEKAELETALRSFFGLVVADWQIRKLLGETSKPLPHGIARTAQKAVDQFLILYGTSNKKQHAKTGE